MRRGARLGGGHSGTDAGRLAAAAKPDVFCFCTLPTLRTEMIRTGIDSGARLIAMEKPVALTSAEAWRFGTCWRRAA